MIVATLNCFVPSLVMSASYNSSVWIKRIQQRGVYWHCHYFLVVFRKQGAYLPHDAGFSAQYIF